MLIAIALFGVVPEVASQYGWIAGPAWVAMGFAALWVVDRFVYSICPACSHTHEHDACAAPLHGFAPPLLIAIAIHSFIDGWALAASQRGPDMVRLGFLLGIALHKIPEGLALGAIVRASLGGFWKSLLASVAAEAMTLAGGAAAFGMAANLGPSWLGILLAAAAGTLLYLGYHAIEGELHRRA